jgi:NADPH:quinone reductase-like Zn-dependent oxidoreductase
MHAASHASISMTIIMRDELEAMDADARVTDRRTGSPAGKGKIMKAFVLDRYGKHRALQAVDLPTPELRDDEVLVQVHGAGLNQLDAKIRDGEFKLVLPYRLPIVLGHDVAGVEVQVGPRVRQFKAGDEVYARTDDFRIGTLAEYVPVKEASLAPKPRGLGMEEAASIPLVGLTAWQALVEKAGLKPGQKVFIQAGSGGVGTFAIQLAKHLGATVATTTSTANVALVKRLGADIVIDYKSQDFEDVLGDQDVVLNSQDGETLEKSLRVLKRGGKLISISGPPDPEFGETIAAPGFVKLVMRFLSAGIRRRARRRGVSYSFLFMKANGRQLREITRLIEAGAIRPVLDRTFPFEATNEALAYVDAGRAKGKVVVKLA